MSRTRHGRAPVMPAAGPYPPRKAEPAHSRASGSERAASPEHASDAVQSALRRANQVRPTVPVARRPWEAALSHARRCMRIRRPARQYERGETRALHARGDRRPPAAARPHQAVAPVPLAPLTAPPCAPTVVDAQPENLVVTG